MNDYERLQSKKDKKKMENKIDILRRRCKKKNQTIKSLKRSNGRLRKKVQEWNGLTYLNTNKVIDGERRAGFVGFIATLENVIEIYKNYIIKNQDAYLLTYKLSQDHIELFFSAERRQGGNSNNPTPRSYIYIYKQLLLHADIKGSEKGNCIAIDQTELIKIYEKELEKLDDTELISSQRRKG